MIVAIVSGAQAAPAVFHFTPPAWRPYVTEDLTMWTGPKSYVLVGEVRGRRTTSLSRLALRLVRSDRSYTAVQGPIALSVCDDAAERIIGVTHRGVVYESQIQDFGGAVGLAVYVRAKSAHRDPAIESVLSHLCATAVFAREAPPRGWHRESGSVLGAWSARDASLMQLTRFPADPKIFSELSRLYARSAPGSELDIRSHRIGTLCGNPAFFFAAVDRRRDGAPAMIRSVFTQTSRLGYAVTYQHAAATRDDPGALAAMASLCAGHDTAKTRLRPAPSHRQHITRSPRAATPGDMITPAPDHSPFVFYTPAPRRTAAPTASPVF